MDEVCYCGRAGEIEDRVPVWLGNGLRALCCPNPLCGHLEYLRWLPADARNRILDEAEARQAQRQAQRRGHAASSVRTKLATTTAQAAGDRQHGTAAASPLVV